MGQTPDLVNVIEQMQVTARKLRNATSAIFTLTREKAEAEE